MNWLLIIIGASLFGLSVVLIILGSFYSKKLTSESSIDYKRDGGYPYRIIPLRLQFDSDVEGKINVTEGELEFSLQDYFDSITQHPREWASSAYERWKGHGKHNFSRNLKAGDHMLTLEAMSGVVKAELKWTVTYHIYYLKRLVDLGLVFVEVSIPLLVTGLVI